MIKNISIAAVAPKDSVIFIKSHRPLGTNAPQVIHKMYADNKELKEKNISVILVDHAMDIVDCSPVSTQKTATTDPKTSEKKAEGQAGGGENPSETK